jgi:hypothetical protein
LRYLVRFLQARHIFERHKTSLTPTIYPQSRNLKPRSTIRTLRQQPQLVALTSRRYLQEVDKVKFPGLPYVMLHSLSHLLITAVSLECGYAASSIRERIYAGEAGYGILLYTGSAGSEGTLGGLVEVGKRIEYHARISDRTRKIVF